MNRIKISCFGIVLLLAFASALGSDSSSVREQQIVDSLRKELRSPQHDTTKAQVFLALAKQLKATHTEQSSAYLDSAKVLIDKGRNSKDLGLYYELRARIFGIRSEDQKALDYFDSALHTFTELKFTEQILELVILKGVFLGYLSENTKAYENYMYGISLADSNKNQENLINLYEGLGNLHNNMGMPEQALFYYDEALRFSIKIKNKRQEMICKANLGQTYSATGKLEKAMQYQLEAFEYFKETGDLKLLIGMHNNLSYLFNIIGDINASIFHLKEGLKVAKTAGDLRTELVLLKNLSETYKQNGNLDSAYTLVEYVLAKNKEIGNLKGASRALLLLGEITALNKNYNKANNLFLQSLDLGKQSENLEAISDTYRAIATLNKVQSKYKKAILYADSAVTTAKKGGLLNSLNLNLKLRYELFVLLGDYKNAFEAYQSYIETKDSLNILGQVNKIDKLRFQYESEAKGIEIKKLQADAKVKGLTIEKNKLINNIILILSAFVLILILFVVVVLLLKKNASFKQKEAKLILQSLRCQMNPHFLFNALGSIQNYVLQEKNTQASEYLLKFATLVRNVLNNSVKEGISLENEVDMISLYMELEAERLQHKFDFSIVIDKTLKADEIQIPPLLVQPFVENAVWHGMAYKEEKGEIKLSFSALEDKLICVIEDNGIGRKRSEIINKKNNIKSESKGIEITKERLHILGVKWKGSCSLDFEDLDPGLRVIISIPLRNLY